MKDARYKQNKKQSLMTASSGIKKCRKLYKKLPVDRLSGSLWTAGAVLTFCSGF